MNTLKMTVAEWVAVQDNPIQRDTERHAAKAKHLLTPLPTHNFVFAAQLPGGNLIKLDGHTRALLWKRGDVPSPRTLIVGICPVETKKEAEDLYKTFDSSNALETTRDKVSGAFNRYGFEPQSGLIAAGNLTFALRTAYSIFLGGSASGGNVGSTEREKHGKARNAIAKADVYTMINEFSYELAALDGFALGQGQATSGIVAAFIVSYRKYGHKITPFWTAVFGNAGSKSGGQMDAIQALCELILSRRGNFGGSAVSDMVSRSLTAIEKWLKDEMLYSIPRPMDTTGYLIGAEKPTERLIKKADIPTHIKGKANGKAAHA